MSHRLDLGYEVEFEDGWYKTKLTCKLNGENVFISRASFTSLLEVIDDARFHADSTIGLLRQSLTEQLKTSPEQSTT